MDYNKTIFLSIWIAYNPTPVPLFFPWLHWSSLEWKPKSDLVSPSGLTDSLMIMTAAADVLGQADLFNYV